MTAGHQKCLTVPCPVCGAKAGERCKWFGYGFAGFHVQRKEALKKQEERGARYDSE